ncbi:hypothetical protein CSA37_06425 [Candidatus Fermentibacteria bacterium]|nr:MAG: hypothetical protein CSA37_06425 [Candidatus Fermentibacteria bacterium]
MTEKIDFRNFLEKSGFAEIIELDNSGRILSGNCPVLKLGKNISECFSGFSLDTVSVQTVTAGRNSYRVAAVQSDTGYTVLLSEIDISVSSPSIRFNIKELHKSLSITNSVLVILKSINGDWIYCNDIADSLRRRAAPPDGSVTFLSSVCSESDRKAWESGTAVRCDEQFADGRTFDVYRSPVWNSDGTSDYLMIIAEDVTHLRLLEKKARCVNRLLDTLHKTDRIIFESHLPEELIEKTVAVILESELFQDCTFSLPKVTCSHLDSLEWQGSVCIGLTLPGMPGKNWVCLRLSADDGYFRYILCKPAEDSMNCVLDESHTAILSDLAGNLNYALKALKLRKEQRKTAQEVLKTRNMLNAFLENFPGPAFIRDSQSRYLKVNSKLKNMKSYSDWIKKFPEEIYPADVVERLRARDQKVLKKGYLCQVRNLVHHNGDPLKLETHYFRIDQEGNEPLIGGVALDITDRLRDAQALMKTEERYRAIHENTGNAIVIIDHDGIVVSANANSRRLSGYLPEEVVGKRNWIDFVHPEDVDKVTAIREERLASEFSTQMEYEFRFKAKDGSFKHVHACASTIPNSGGMGVIALSDISSLIEYQIKLNESLEKTSSLLRAIPDLMLVMNCNGDFLDYYTNDPSALLIPSEEVIGGNISNIGLKPEYLSQALDAIADALNNHRAGTFEYSVNLSEGRHYYEAVISPYDHDSVLVICRDVTKRKKAEEEQKKLEAQIRHVQKLESLGLLAGGIAHDFNNILMAISGNAYLAGKAVNEGTDSLEYLEAIEKAVARASDLAGQMLSYSGRGESRIVPVNLSEIAADVSEILRISMSRKAELIFDMDPLVPVIMADAAQVRQVVMNLITNASEALEQNTGKVIVSTGSRFCDREYLDTLNRTEKLKTGLYSWIMVKDTGKGMEKDLFEKIFDPFFTTKFAGRGLGLSAVLGIMSSHCGALDIQSVPGEGSSFKALFPVAAEIPSLEDSSSSDNSTVKKRSGKILFVDDEPLIRSIAETMITGMGLSVTLASNGREGLNKFKASSEEFSIVILDLTMPEMDGDEVFREIRKMSPKTPVLISSGYNEHEMLSRFTDIKPEGFLKKPYSVSELAGKIQALLFP